MEPTIWKSRKFWLMVVDVVVSLATYFVGKYLSPETSKDVLFLIGAMQPVVILVIVSITVQNVADMKARAGIQEAHLSLEETKEYRLQQETVARIKAESQAKEFPEARGEDEP